VAAAKGYVDDIFEPGATRRRIISALDVLSGKRENGLAKKHGNIPL
jgi:acetyl-CoA carboxylase carboxyltransferase component